MMDCDLFFVQKIEDLRLGSIFYLFYFAYVFKEGNFVFYAGSEGRLNL
jgi:hypothetical protein